MTIRVTKLECCKLSTLESRKSGTSILKSIHLFIYLITETLSFSWTYTIHLMIFLPGIIILACASSSPAFHMMYSAYKLNKQGDGIQP